MRAIKNLKQDNEESNDLKIIFCARQCGKTNLQTLYQEKLMKDFLIKEEKIDTEFLIGEDYFLPFDLKIWEMNQSTRNVWAREQLEKMKKKLKANTFLCVRRNKELIPINLIIRNFNERLK